MCTRRGSAADARADLAQTRDPLTHGGKTVHASPEPARNKRQHSTHPCRDEQGRQAAMAIQGACALRCGCCSLLAGRFGNTLGHGGDGLALRVRLGRSAVPRRVWLGCRRRLRCPRGSRLADGLGARERRALSSDGSEHGNLDRRLRRQRWGRGAGIGERGGASWWARRRAISGDLASAIGRSHVCVVSCDFACGPGVISGAPRPASAASWPPRPRAACSRPR